jgi:hypothetical protein
MEQTIDIMEELGDIFTVDLVLTARAEAERALKAHLDTAMGGNARARKIVTQARSVYRLAQLLAQLPETEPVDLRILRVGVEDLQELLAS